MRLMLKQALLGNAHCNRQDLPNMERHYRWGGGWRRICRMVRPAGDWLQHRVGVDRNRTLRRGLRLVFRQKQPTLMALHKLAICCEKTGRREKRCAH
ncbi:MAG: hypothetical protein ACLUI3_06530 [Christensenellales bacterium]